jgi:uncharacterized iron-regulated membrane protein
VRVSARRWSDVIHKWLGFSVGAILVIAGLTGSLLAFYVEIERQFYPHMQTPDPHVLPSSYEAVYQRLSQLPVDPPGGTWKIEIPPDGGVITSRYSAPAGSTVRTRMVTLDPITFEVLRDAHWSDTFFTWIYDLHQDLLLGERFDVPMGIATLMMLVMLAVGVGSWLLPVGHLRAKFRLKWRHASVSRRTYDVHKLGGAIALIPLALTVATGALITLSVQVRPVLNSVSTLKPTEPPVQSVPFDGARRVPVDQVLAQAPAYFPDSRVVWVRVPASATQFYDLQIRQAGAPMTRFPRTHLYLDQYTGKVLAVYDPKADGVGDTILNWLVPLHDGKAWGMFGRVMVMVLGLVPAVMFVTGFMRWKQKRMPRHASSRRRDLDRAASPERRASPRQSPLPGRVAATSETTHH